MQDVWHSTAYSPQNADADITEVSFLDELVLAWPERGSDRRDEAMRWAIDLGLDTSVLHAEFRDHPRLKKLASVLAALMRARPLCLLDEPTAGLTRGEKAIVATLMANRLREGKAILCVTHDAGFVSAVNEMLGQNRRL